MAPQLHGKMSLVVLSTILVILLAMSGLFWQFATSKPAVKIGVLHSLTGTMATSETPLVDAVRMAVEEANRSGGVNGAQIEMVVADCRSDADYCAQQAERLITQDKVKALFGCWTSSCRKAVKPVVEQHHILLFYPVQYEGLEQSQEIIYTGAVPNQQIIPMVTWALQHQGKRAYLIGSNYIFPRAANQITKKLLQAQGGTLVAERYAVLGEKDMDEFANEIAEMKPDFVLNTLNGDSNLYFFRALRKAGIRAEDIPVFSTSIAETEMMAIGPELMKGHYAAWNYFQSVQSEENRAFIERFRQRFGKDRVLDDPMEASYIGVKLWVSGVRGTGNTAMQTVITHIELDSLNAPEGIVAVDPKTRHLWKTARIGKVRDDGQFDIVWQSSGLIRPEPFPYFIPNVELAKMARNAP